MPRWKCWWPLPPAPAWFIDSVNADQSPGGGAGGLAAVAGYPHLTVPMGGVRGLPVGLSFIGPAWSDARLLALGYAFEQAAPGDEADANHGADRGGKSGSAEAVRARRALATEKESAAQRSLAESETHNPSRDGSGRLINLLTNATNRRTQGVLKLKRFLTSSALYFRITYVILFVSSFMLKMC